MNRLIGHILSIVSLVSMVSCSGNIDTSGDVPEGVLRIFADKTQISADGVDEVTFRAMFGSEDVSNEKTFQLVRTFDGDSKPMAGGVNKFSTVAAGTYTFTATYFYAGKHYSDNSVEVVAKQFFTGEEKEYKRRFFGTLFTSTGCNSCPLAAKGLKDLQARYPGEISIAAFHSNSNNVVDPMTISETELFNTNLGGFLGLPAFFWNMRQSSKTQGSAFTDSFEKEKNEYSTYSGVRITSSFDQNTSSLEVTVGVTSNVATRFHALVVLVEDDIPATGDYEQNGQKSDYIHYNVVRDVLTMPLGDKLNSDLPLTVGVESTQSWSVSLPDTWNVENMRIIACGISSSDSGYTWTVNNVNECKVGENAPYLYAE